MFDKYYVSWMGFYRNFYIYMLYKKIYINARTKIDDSGLRWAEEIYWWNKKTNQTNEIGIR